MSSTSGQYNFSWVPPDTSELIFTNCSLATSFYAGLESEQDRTKLVADYLLDGLASYLQKNDYEQPSVEQLHFWAANPDVYNKMLDYAESPSCHTELCPKLGWEGDADIAGSGVSYLT